MNQKLQWGLKHVVPEHAPVAWGARAIIDNRGTAYQFDLLPDRQAMAGPRPLREALGRALNAMGGHDGYLARAQATYRDLLQRYELKWSDERVVDLVADEGHFCVKADPRGSFGYLYVAAWFDADDVDPSAALRLGAPGYGANDDRLRWSHPAAPPTLGEDRHWSHGVGRGTVVGYLNTHGYLAALVVPYKTFCNPKRLPVVTLYGCDIRSEDTDE